MITAPKFEVQEDSLKYQARTKLAELTDEIASARSLNKISDKILKATKLRLWLKALDYSDYLTRAQREQIWFCIIEISGVYNFPTAPVLQLRTRPSILIGNGNTTTVNNTYTDSTEFVNLDIDTGTEVVDSFAYSLGAAVRWDYVVTDGTNQRSGIFLTTWLSDGSSISDGTEVSSLDIGDTDDIVFSVDIDAGLVRLKVTAASDDWSCSGKRYLF